MESNLFYPTYSILDYYTKHTIINNTIRSVLTIHFSIMILYWIQCIYLYSTN